MRSSSFSRWLLMGSLVVSPLLLAQSSDSIRSAQQALKAKGFDPGPEDGVDGAKTKAATRAFQKQQNIQVDGKLGPQTLDSLGVQQASSGTQMRKAGTNIKSSYTSGGKQIGEGGKEFGTSVRHGEIGGGAKDLGKGVGQGAAKIGVGTGHAAKNVAKGVKNALTPNKDK